jgi:hypothetical protein
MTPPALPLDALAQRISRQESELTALRQEYDARQEQLMELTGRKQELERELRDVEATIAAIDHGRGRPGRPAKPPVPSAEPAVRPNLGLFLVGLLREAGRPMLVKELVAETKSRNYPTKSGNLGNLIQTRIKELCKRKVLRRLGRKRGVTLGRRADAADMGASAAKKATPHRGRRKDQPTLAQVLREVLRQADRPLKIGELAEQVLATGYRTTSSDFPNVVGVNLARLKGVVRVHGEGYRWKGK